MSIIYKDQYRKQLHNYSFCHINLHYSTMVLFHKQKLILNKINYSQFLWQLQKTKTVITEIKNVTDSSICINVIKYGFAKV